MTEDAGTHTGTCHRVLRRGDWTSRNAEILVPAAGNPARSQHAPPPGRLPGPSLRAQAPPPQKSLAEAPGISARPAAARKREETELWTEGSTWGARANGQTDGPVERKGALNPGLTTARSRKEETWSRAYPNPVGRDRNVRDPKVPGLHPSHSWGKAGPARTALTRGSAAVVTQGP